MKLIQIQTQLKLNLAVKSLIYSISPTEYLHCLHTGPANIDCSSVGSSSPNISSDSSEYPKKEQQGFVDKTFMTEGEEGFIVEPGNTSSISEKIKFFYDNPNKIIEMGNKARTRVEKEFTYDCVAKRIVNFCNTKS